MTIVAYTSAELRVLKAFMTKVIMDAKAKPARISGVASGCILKPLKIYDPELGRKVRDRSGIVSVAQKLGFTIDAYPGGGRNGPCIWEYIDLP